MTTGTGQVEKASTFMHPRVAPGGGRVALLDSLSRSMASTIWTYDLDRGAMSRVTFEGVNITPAWSPDGASLVFSSDREGPFNLFRNAADGTGEAERLTHTPNIQVSGEWSRDGKYFAFSERRNETGWDLRVLELGKDEEPRDFLATPFDELDPVFSPDGRFVAYMSLESGRHEVYVRPFPGPGPKEHVSTGGGQYPRFNPEGGELFYQLPTESGVEVRLMAVDVTIRGDAFVPGKPRELFRGPYVLGPRDQYDPFPDGKSFVMLRRKDSSRPRLTFVLNWFNELRRLVK